MNTEYALIGARAECLNKLLALVTATLALLASNSKLPAGAVGESLLAHLSVSVERSCTHICWDEKWSERN